MFMENTWLGAQPLLPQRLNSTLPFGHYKKSLENTLFWVNEVWITYHSLLEAIQFLLLCTLGEWHIF